MTWLYEKPDEGQPRTPAVCSGDQQLCLPCPESFNPEPKPSVDNDSINSNNLSSVLLEINVPSGVIARTRGKRKRINGTAWLPTINESPRSAEESAGRFLWGMRSPKVVKPSKLRFTVANTYFRKQDNHVSGPGETSNSIRQNGMSLKRGGGEVNLLPGNEQASAERPLVVSSVPRRSKWIAKRIAAQMGKAEAI